MAFTIVHKVLVLSQNRETGERVGKYSQAMVFDAQLRHPVSSTVVEMRSVCSLEGMLEGFFLAGTADTGSIHNLLLDNETCPRPPCVVRGRPNLP